MAKTRTPNDDRSDRFNPTSAAFKAAQDHESNIYNSTSSEFQAVVDNKLKQTLEINSISTEGETK